MGISMVFAGLNGALGLYSGIKGIFDSSKAKREQRKLMDRAYAEEDGWYRRNYFTDHMNSTTTRAAIKRVENTLRRKSQQERAHARIVGGTPEYALARNRQGLQAMENVMTNAAATESDRKRSVDAQHRQNRNALLGAQATNAANERTFSAQLAGNGLNLLQNALIGVNWGKEDHGYGN